MRVLLYIAGWLVAALGFGLAVLGTAALVVAGEKLGFVALLAVAAGFMCVWFGIELSRTLPEEHR